MCITNPLKISDFQGNLLHMLLFLQKHAFYFSILRIKEGLLHVQQPLFIGFYRSTDTRTVCGWSFFILSAKDVRTWKNLWNS